MNEIKNFSLASLNNDFEDLNLQNGGYIYIPHFKIAASQEEPYRSDYYCIGLLKQGEMFLQTNLIQHHIKAPALIFAEPTAIKRWDKSEAVYDASSILVPSTFIQEKLIESSLLKAFSDLPLYGAYITNLTEEEFSSVKKMFDIFESYPSPQNSFQIEIIRGTVYSLLNSIADFYTREHKPEKTSGILSIRFRKLVSEFSQKERSVNFYADTLHVHPRYLSRMVLKETGVPASEWIRKQVIMEAKVLLQKNDLTLTHIVSILNFPDQSTFGKYFKKYAKMTPKEYRLFTQNLL
jgi:AraC family transcriptional activator of pobA